MKNQIVKAQDFGLSENQVSNVDVAFLEKVKERELISEIYNQIIKKDINSEVAKEARDLRLKAVKVKTGIASIHKTQKEFALAFGKYCDSWKRKETEPIQQMIDNLLEIEKFEEIQRQKKLEELQKQRENQLSPYVDDANERNLSEMDEDVWDAYLNTKKKEHEKRLEAERKAEEERIEAAKIEDLNKQRESQLKPYYSFVPNEHPNFGTLSNDEWEDFFQEMKNAKEDYDLEQERIRKENELLKSEADKRAKAEAERLAKEAEDRKNREEKERKEREAYESKLKAEREEKEKIRLELEAKQEAERKAKEEEKQKIQEELNKGDESKIKDLILDIESLKKKYVFKSQKNIKLYKDVSELFDKVITFINN